jgi:hypothetical protein
MSDELTPEEAERRAKELAHRLLNTPPMKRRIKEKNKSYDAGETGHKDDLSTD